MNWSYHWILTDIKFFGYGFHFFLYKGGSRLMLEFPRPSGDMPYCVFDFFINPPDKYDAIWGVSCCNWRCSYVRYR